MTDNSNKEILEAIQGLANQNQSLADSIQALASHMDEQFEQAEDRNNLRFIQLEKTLEERITDLRKDITLQFGGVYKRLDLVNERTDKLYIAIDGFIVLHKKLDQEFGMLQAKYERLEIRLSKLEARFAV